MKRATCTVLTLAAAVGLSAGASGQSNPYGQISNVSLSSSPKEPLFDKPTKLSGRVRRGGRRVAVALQSRAFPGTAGFRTIARGRAGTNGSYSFTLRPQSNHYYRVVASTRPSTRSPDLLVRVRMLTGLRASRSLVRRGALVRFSGAVFPKHDGRLVYLQRRSPRGRFITVGKATLRAGDATKSLWARRLRVRRTGVYRAVVRGHEDHARGESRLRTVIVLPRRR